MSSRTIDLAYAAGFIDADGCILIERSRKEAHWFGVEHIPRICGYNADPNTLMALSSLFGGKIRKTSRRNKPAHYKDAYYWQVTGKRAIVAARELMPYLKRKSLQAYILSCFDHEKKWSKGGVDVKMSQEEFNRREDLVMEIRSYNHGNFEYQTT